MLNKYQELSPSYNLTLKKELADIHGGFRKLTEADFYPAHEKRKESSEYKEIHKRIIVTQNAGCVVCGVNHSVLSDPEQRKNKVSNYYQAAQMELHHFHIEWALANAIDVDKFNRLLKMNLARLYPEFKIYQAFMDRDTILNWVDHHEHNLMPLCDVHHRHKFYGIHAISYPMWTTSNLYSDDFIKSIQDEINSQMT